MRIYGIIIGLAIGVGILFFRSGKLEKLNPVNPDNVVNTQVSKIVQKVTGDENATLGTKLFDWFDTAKNYIPFVDSVEEKATKNANTFRETLEPDDEDIDINNGDLWD